MDVFAGIPGNSKGQPQKQPNHDERPTGHKPDLTGSIWGELRRPLT